MRRNAVLNASRAAAGATNLADGIDTSTARRLFGTDGIRGKANTDPMTAGIALRLGQAAGLLFTRG